MPRIDRARVVMHSFKGGAGRTVSTANLAWILAAEHKKRVLVIDADVESAGASVLFGVEPLVRSGKLWSFQDVLRGQFDPPHGSAESRATISLAMGSFARELWPRMRAEIPGIPAPGYLHVMASRTMLHSDDEVRGLSQEANRTFSRLMDKLDALPDPPDIILFDAPSGLQETGILAIEVADVLVTFFRWSRQFINGTTQFVDQVVRRTHLSRNLSQVLLVPTAVPRGGPARHLEVEIRRRQQQFQTDIEIANRDADRAGWVRVEPPIYECDVLKWDERIFLKETEFLADEGARSVVLDYRRLAETILEITD